MADLSLTLAVEHYDRHLPLLEGKVVADDIDLQVHDVSPTQVRHQRMLDERAWDACELGLSPYLMAKARGARLTAIPIFPRRLFSQSQMYVNVRAEIRSPQDLIGKRVGLRTYQTTLSVLAKGDLQHEYGVPLDGVTWVTSADDPVAANLPDGVNIQRAASGRDIGAMLAEGEVDAVFLPRMPSSFVDGVPQVVRLFSDPKAEEAAYYRKNGFFPIMHVVALKSEVVEEHPWVAMSLFRAFEQANEMAFHYYDDPNWSYLAWSYHAAQEQQEALGSEAWTNGIVRNRKNLELYIQYQVEQGLIPRRLDVEELFHSSTLDT